MIGSLCVLYHKPKALTVNQKKAFTSLASEVMRGIEVNFKAESITSEKEKELDVSKSKLFDLYDAAPDIMFSTAPSLKESSHVMTQLQSTWVLLKGKRLEKHCLIYFLLVGKRR